MGALNPDLTYDINLEATARLGELARRCRRFPLHLRFLLLDLWCCRQRGRLDETAAFNPVSAYAISKVRSEERLSALASDSFSPVFMRNATAYGVSSRTRFDLVVNNLSGWGDTARHHKGHVGRHALAAARPYRGHFPRRARRRDRPARGSPQQAFNVGRNDANYQVRDIAEAVKAAFPAANLESPARRAAIPAPTRSISPRR